MAKPAPSNVTPLPRPPSNKRLVSQLRKDVLRTSAELAGASEEVKRIRRLLAPAVDLERWCRTAHHAAVLELRRETERGQ